jgi:hypothetical protein
MEAVIGQPFLPRGFLAALFRLALIGRLHHD